MIESGDGFWLQICIQSAFRFAMGVIWITLGFTSGLSFVPLFKHVALCGG
jgi:hypothetical protein